MAKYYFLMNFEKYKQCTNPKIEKSAMPKLKINLILNFGVSPNMSSIQYNAVNAITQMFAKIKCVESEKYSEPNNNISGPTTPAPVGVLIFLLKLRKNFI